MSRGFNSDASPEALAAWDRYRALPMNFPATPEQSEQDAFTSAWDAARSLSASSVLPKEDS